MKRHQKTVLAATDGELASLLLRLYQRITSGPMDVSIVERVKLAFESFHLDLDVLISRTAASSAATAIEAVIKIAQDAGYTDLVVNFTAVRQEVISAANDRLNSSDYKLRTIDIQHGGQAKVIAEIIDGLQAREGADLLAKRLAQYILPSADGGVAYAARRIARTELASAFNQAAADMDARLPFVIGTRWNLSGSHKAPDICNQFADGGDPGAQDECLQYGIDPAGVYDSGAMPAVIGHPNCLCYFTSVLTPLGSYKGQQQEGAYDNAN